MKKESRGKSIPTKHSAGKIFGANSLQLPEDEDVSSRLVGSIVEKGISDNPQNKPLAPTSAPRLTVLPFPVARHRSHGPHWTPVGGQTRCGSDDDENNTKDDDLAGFEPAAAFANPVQRKEKKGLNFSRWREIVARDDSSISQKKDEDNHLVMRSKEQKMATKVSEISDRMSTDDDAQPQKMSLNINGNADDMIVDEVSPAAFSELSQNVIEGKRDEIMEEMEPEPLKISKSRQRQVVTQRQTMSTLHISSSYTSNNMRNEQESSSLESQIDAENRAWLQGMSNDEIAEARAEILEKMNPAVIEALRKRGQDKLKKSEIAAKVDVNLQDEKKIRDAIDFSVQDVDVSHKARTVSSTGTKRGQLHKAMQNFSPSSSTLWNTWSERVEAVRELRFSLDGNIVHNDFVGVPEIGNVSTQSGYTANNVSERDFLRTEGDPAAAGYTIKEAVALTRSVVPGQRALALHLIGSVLDKALHDICQNQVGCDREKAKIKRSTDCSAIWAYALGPEPEIALSLRMCLDDNHNSVVLACAKVIECIVSYDVNESFFDISEKIATYPKDVYTAPVFRSRPEIDVGFLQGGFWKYNAKPSGVLPFAEDLVDNKTEGEHTIQDDVVVAGQDFVAGLVRMGIIPRLRYLLEKDPSAALEECIISILVAIARHSPTCANAIMMCQRLVQTVVNRFTMKDPMDVSPSKIKSVTLLKVLAQSDKKNCTDFVKNGIFRRATWHLYHHAFSLDQWVKLGRENCKLSSALMVEQLRFWKVCIQYGYCVSDFSDFFPALCMWLNLPTFEKLIGNHVLCEFSAITEEVFLVLGALTRALPNFYSDMDMNNQMSKVAAEDIETWCWVQVAPIVDLAIKWIALRSDPCMSKLFEEKERNNCRNLVGCIWVVSAVLHMLSCVLDRVIPEDTTSLPVGHVPWLPQFVPKIGLEIVKNGFLSFSRANAMEHGNDPTQAVSFVEYLYDLREQGEHETSIASVFCLCGLVKVVVSVDKLIHLASSEIHIPSYQGKISSGESLILAEGMVNMSVLEFRSVLTVFMKLIASEWQLVQSIERFGRGGPAPGVGVGWGAVGGGFWSKNVLLAQTDAEFLIALLEIFQIVSAEDLLTGEEMTFTMQKINSVFCACLILGPRDGLIMEKAWDTLLQVPVLKYLDLCIRHFISLNKGFKPFTWEYKEDEYRLFAKILSSHLRNRWLTVKKKVKPVDGSNSVGQKISEGRLLDTIHEDLDVSNVAIQDHYCTSLVAEWAHQRLPLPMHWFLSPISTINGSKYANVPGVSDIINQGHDVSDLLEVVKGGVFFLLGIEVMTSFVSTKIQSPIWSVPLTWKLHSLSVSLLVGMDVLEEEKSRDVYETLQEVYGKFLDELWLSERKEFILDDHAKFSAETGENYSIDFLRFQSDIHESYSTFIEALVEQFAGVSYGDVVFGRQVAIYLHRSVETSVRLAAWNTLSNARVLELLPSLANCFANSEGYLEPVEDNERMLEAYVKSWVSGALDKSVARRSMTFTLVLHHLTHFIFHHSPGESLSSRNKLAKSLLRDCSHKRQREAMMLELIRYQKPGVIDDSSLQMSEVDRRFKLLGDVCEGNSSLLSVVEKLRLSFQKRT
ncbi:transcriptional elongation regulator MINIYO [Diospyros lotus]|uniref:transcriptional elongation regulator MINIYO n=1 Tax=Diospyros lotus TaxID=55363 RepID=UPI00225267C1|nr:transcriptional elongation regulator MINIYO [Diospyros lotus]